MPNNDFTKSSTHPKKNLILIYPPKISTGFTGDISLALLYLAGTARDSGVCDNISIFDFNAPVGVGKTMDDLVKLLISQDGLTIVGINCLYSALFPSVRDIAKTIKEKIPGTKVITGGMHPTLFAREIIDNCPEIDAVGIGESDIDFPKLLRFLYGEGNLNALEGVCLRLNGETILKHKLQYVKDLDILPKPGYEFYNFGEYAVNTDNWWSPDGFKISNLQIPLLTSRSCPNKCNFCSMRLVMGDRYRARSAENVFEEIKYLYNTFGINYFKIADDNITLNRTRIVDICKMIIESGIKVYFDTPNGISLKTLDEEVVVLMRQAGFIMIALAVESGSDYIRNEIMGKKISREQIVSAFKMCRKVGMNTNAYFIIGMPEDTEETLNDTINLIKEIDATRISISVAKPLPGTRLFEQCVQDDLMIGGFDINTLWTGNAEKDNLKTEEFYIKRLINYSTRQFWIQPYNLSMDKLMEIDLELQQIAYIKARAWVEHVKNNHI